MPEYLTKSRYMLGLHCVRRLWRTVHRPQPHQEPVPGSPQEVGQRIGRHAHRLFADGVLIDEPPWEHAAAVARTRALMQDPRVGAIFEAAFEHDAVRIRVDVLERRPGGCWGLREVKSGGAVRDEYIDDVALQAHVLDGCAVRVDSMELLHVNSRYARGSHGIAWPDVFARVEVAPAVESRRSLVPATLSHQLRVVGRDAEPAVEPSKRCLRHGTCEHWEHCSTALPEDWIGWLPHLSHSRHEALAADGIHAIRDIPDHAGLTAAQTRIRDAIRRGEPIVEPGLAARLVPFGPPAVYLDFEAMLPAIPLYPDTRPYQALPFQWSLHRVDGDGRIGHEDFLADGHDDPRRAFAQTLIKALRDSPHPIIVYSSYERSRLAELAAAFPDLARALDEIAGRLHDLLPVVRDAVYHPGFRFRFSIKTVAPALCPDLTYADLDTVADGTTAAVAFERLVTGGLSEEENGRVRRALLAYCERDTLALVKLHRALRVMARPPGELPHRTSVGAGAC
ncbi:DUF2779 domain-containing protein [Azospirillum brasilense]|uniref:DUF2779 domain-containing protein n=1 Tax=Azospirillum brasilense TaxID=192 RepID=UPI001EDA0DAC|nr:DUF2779 domain-containing protein [Azospirillum brasilense]UKJ75410.1 DUF2779 domain-containing protein [Azospirillum brasilense]